ncbi:MAG TPA: hypothetical protein VFA26_22210 [Gemmataceae bacterium]|nr:hypothetical protein [Gemmataceae bacterium]
MSTKLHDVASQAILGVGAPPQTATGTVTGTGGDMLAGDGRCFAIQQVGAVSGTSPTLDGKVQESSDNSTWTDVAGAAFAQVTASNNYQAITFDRTKRYLRYVGTIGGTSPSFALAVVISEQKKQV